MVRKSKDSLSEARTYALKLLNYRSRSKREIIERLRLRGHNEHDIIKTVEYLEDIDLIDDQRLAYELFNYAVNVKALGPFGIRAFLSGRGIEQNLINRVMSEHSDETALSSARNFVSRKQRTMACYPPDVVKRRLWGMLKRRGYSTNTIRMALKTYRSKCTQES